MSAEPEGRTGRVLLVTGLSGAGKSTALKVLEDLGYEAVDNLPLTLMPDLLGSVGGAHGHLALGIDIRTRDFGIEAFTLGVDRLYARRELDVRLVYFDCDDDALQRRFTETRRRHPLATDRPIADGIRHERNLMRAIKDRADLVIDTTALAPADLRRLLGGHFAIDRRSALAVSVTSFSFRRGVPREADLVFDVRFLANPHYDPALRPLTGRDADVAAHIARDDGFAPFFASVTALLRPLLPRYEAEGKSYLTIAVGCTGGRHRSVFVAERLAQALAEDGREVRVRHRDIDAGEPARHEEAG